MQYYVYEWFNKDTKEIFYVGKGCKNRYKQTRKRNKWFNEYYSKNNCESRIVKYFENEQDAFVYENKKIIEYKNKKQCFCNLDNGGNGGCNFIWTPEMRKYKSENNPMKNQYQRERMSKNNPMKNPDIAKKQKKKICKKVILGNKMYDSLKDLAKYYNVCDNAVQYWLKRGYGRNNELCYYYGKKPKKIIIRTHETTNKPIYIDGKYFKNVKSGANYIGVWSESIIRAIKNNKLCKGHKCEYVNQQPSYTNSDKSSVEGSTTNE
jgi:hypothetical protein